MLVMLPEEVHPPAAVPAAKSELSQREDSPQEDPDKIRAEVFKRMFPDHPRKPSE